MLKIKSNSINSSFLSSKECDYDPYDYSDHGCTSYDYEDDNDNEDTCSHKQFQDPSQVPPLKSLVRYKNIELKRCCEIHSYVFNDNCEVRNKINSILEFKLDLNR